MGLELHTHIMQRQPARQGNGCSKNHFFPTGLKKKRCLEAIFFGMVKAWKKAGNGKHEVISMSVVHICNMDLLLVVWVFNVVCCTFLYLEFHVLDRQLPTVHSHMYAKILHCKNLSTCQSSQISRHSIKKFHELKSGSLDGVFFDLPFVSAQHHLLSRVLLQYSQQRLMPLPVTGWMASLSCIVHMDTQMSHGSECWSLLQPSDKSNHQHTNTHISYKVSSRQVYLHYNVRGEESSEKKKMRKSSVITI